MKKSKEDIMLEAARIRVHKYIDGMANSLKIKNHSRLVSFKSSYTRLINTINYKAYNEETKREVRGWNIYAKVG